MSTGLHKVQDDPRGCGCCSRCIVGVLTVGNLWERHYERSPGVISAYNLNLAELAKVADEFGLCTRVTRNKEMEF